MDFLYAPQRFVDRHLNNITMYRLMVYGLSILAVLSVAFGFAGRLGLSGTSLLVSFVTIPLACLVTNSLLGKFWPAVTNAESFLITALILGFILPPANSLSGWLALVLAAVVAMASKYLLAPFRKHIFNPAAFAALALGLAGILPATWWVGNPTLLPFVAVFGLLVLRKLRRGSLFGSFLLVSLVVTALVNILNGTEVPPAFYAALASSPLIFLGTVMLTEPLTAPPRVRQQAIYGAIVGAVFSAQLTLGPVSTSPELALIIGNLFAFAVSPKHKLQLRLQRIKQLSEHVYDFAFTSDRPLRFEPGQYLEWTLPVPGHDSRGNRRTFSIASAPEEKEVHIGIKATMPSRGFKKSLLAMKPGDAIMAGQLGGEFVLPTDTNRKLVFVAGGIGITPFRSMLQHLVASNEQRDIVLFYLVSDPAEVSYQDVLDTAAKHGVNVVPVLSTSQGKAVPADWKHPTGYITKELLEQHAADYAERTFYLSGPNAMVQNYKKLLRGLGLGRRAVITDYFSGY